MVAGYPGYKKFVTITFVFETQRYKAKIENPTTPNESRKTRMVWGSDFVGLLRSKFPGWEDAFLCDKNFSPGLRPQIVFEKIEDGVYDVCFIPVTLVDKSTVEAHYNLM